MPAVGDLRVISLACLALLCGSTALAQENSSASHVSGSWAAFLASASQPIVISKDQETTLKAIGVKLSRKDLRTCNDAGKLGEDRLAACDGTLNVRSRSSQEIPSNCWSVPPWYTTRCGVNYSRDNPPSFPSTVWNAFARRECTLGNSDACKGLIDHATAAGDLTLAAAIRQSYVCAQNDSCRSTGYMTAFERKRADQREANFESALNTLNQATNQASQVYSQTGSAQAAVTAAEMNAAQQTAPNGTSPSASEAAGNYSAAYSDWVRRLLSRAGGWSCPSSLTARDGSPPNVQTDNNSFRDRYVKAAVLYAWAAECHARVQYDNEAQKDAREMMKSLQAAQGLCSNAPVIAGAGGLPKTWPIYKCGELPQQ